MKSKTTLEVPDEIRIVIEEIINAYNNKRLVSIMTNNPTLTLNQNKERFPNKKIIIQIASSEINKNS